MCYVIIINKTNQIHYPVYTHISLPSRLDTMDRDGRLDTLDQLCNEAPESISDSRCENKFNQQDVWDLYSNDNPDVDDAIGTCYCCDKTIFHRALVKSIRLDLDLCGGSWRACAIVSTRISRVNDYRPCCWVCYREIIYYGRDMREYVCMRGYINHTRFSMRDLKWFLQRRQLLASLIDRRIIEIDEDTVVTANDIVGYFVRQYLYNNVDRRKRNADIFYCGTSYFVKAESIYAHYHVLCRDVENVLKCDVFIHALDSLCSDNWLLHGPIQLMLARRHTPIRQTTSSRTAPYPNHTNAVSATYYQIVDEKALEICARKDGMVCVVEPRPPRPIPSSPPSLFSPSPLPTHIISPTLEDMHSKLMKMVEKYVAISGKTIESTHVENILQQCLHDPEMQGESPLMYMSLFSAIISTHVSH